MPGGGGHVEVWPIHYLFENFSQKKGSRKFLVTFLGKNPLKMGNYTIFWMFENSRRGRQARHFTANVPKILDLKSPSEQRFSKNWRWVPLIHCQDLHQYYFKRPFERQYTSSEWKIVKSQGLASIQGISLVRSHAWAECSCSSLVGVHKWSWPGLGCIAFFKIACSAGVFWVGETLFVFVILL